VFDADVQVPCGEGWLDGRLTIPAGARAIVLFAHGSGSSRHSPRNRRVAQELQRHGIATLLFDLLTVEEEQAEALTRHLRFDIELLAGRLIAATDWARKHRRTRGLRIGYFGASSGAAAALVAAARRPGLVGAVVSRGGRPDLAGEALTHVQAPTLLLVGGRDVDLLESNREALDALRVEKRLDIVPGATHLFDEPGMLERVAYDAARWFACHLGGDGLEAMA
jgi:dienelactone hydrolase